MEPAAHARPPRSSKTAGATSTRCAAANGAGFLPRRAEKPGHSQRRSRVQGYTRIVPYRSSLTLMVSMVRDGVVSPSELLEAHLQQIERRNPSINAFTAVAADR